MKLYLDLGCLNRLFDDQTQAKIREEAERLRESWRVISSQALEDETRRNSSLERAVSKLMAMWPVARTISRLDTGLTTAPRCRRGMRALGRLLTTVHRLIKRAERGLC